MKTGEQTTYGQLEYGASYSDPSTGRVGIKLRPQTPESVARADAQKDRPVIFLSAPAFPH